MNNIKLVLQNKKFVKTSSNRPINENWEMAQEFSKYVGLSVPITLRLFKKFGRGKVLSIRSFLADFPADYRGKTGIAYWKLNDLAVKNAEKVKVAPNIEYV